MAENTNETQTKKEESSAKNKLNVSVGDKVQIVNGGMDVTNGKCAVGGKMYGEGGPLWAEVALIDENWSTGGKFGLPATVVKVRCSNQGVVVWQVQPQHIASNIIRASNPDSVQTEQSEEGKAEGDAAAAEEKKPEEEPKPESYNEVFTVENTRAASPHPYAIKMESETWTTGIPTAGKISGGDMTAPIGHVTEKYDTTDVFRDRNRFSAHTNAGEWRALTSEEKANIGNPTGLTVDSAMLNPSPQFSFAYDNSSIRSRMFNRETSIIQNALGFPSRYGADEHAAILRRESKMKDIPTSMLSDKYDYQIIPEDPRYPKLKDSLADNLMKARAALGIHVHGSDSISRAVKMFSYNRFKVPDYNMTHNKSVTHVFFTRPDLYILEKSNNTAIAADQVVSHSEAAMIWERYPELFKLLVDKSVCGDNNNFNFLLSNQVQTFEIMDETLGTNDAGRSWRDYIMTYGDTYTGRSSGQFAASFSDTADYSIIHLIKLWITYIDNVSKGAWSPSYHLNGTTGEIKSSHVFTKTLDYASSVYVFKCGPDGEDVLYWSKYYGVFPISTGASALTWDIGNSIGDGPRLSIQFKYMFKRDLSPISLLEFNNIAGITGDTAVFESAFDWKTTGMSNRPWVGTPFIEIDKGAPALIANGVRTDQKRTKIRLKYLPLEKTVPMLTDKILYKAYLGNKKI